MADPATLLIRALLKLSEGHAELDEHAGTDWASLHFTGMRHHMQLHFVGEAAVIKAEALATSLPRHEFRLPGHIVAEMVASRELRDGPSGPECVLDIEALTVED